MGKLHRLDKAIVAWQRLREEVPGWFLERKLTPQTSFAFFFQTVKAQHQSSEQSWCKSGTVTVDAGYPHNFSNMGKLGQISLCAFPKIMSPYSTVHNLLTSPRGQRVSFSTNDVAGFAVFWHIEIRKAWDVFLEDRLQSRTFCQNRDNCWKFGNV